MEVRSPDGAQRNPGSHKSLAPSRITLRSIRATRTLGYAARSTERLHLPERLTRARHLGPVAIEIGGELLDRLALQHRVQRRLVSEFVHGQMQRRIVQAPEPPGLCDTECLHGIGQMLGLVPAIEGSALLGVGDGGAHDEVG